MKIRHTDGREVEGVDRYELSMHWEKKKDVAHMIYYERDGWSEVKEPKYVDVTAAVTIADSGRTFGIRSVDGPEFIMSALHLGYRLQVCHWFDLPENLMYEIYHMTAKGLVDYIQQYKKPCLIVEKEES